MLWRVWETTAALTEHCWLVGSFGKGGSRYACACVYVCFMLKSHGVIGCVVPYGVGSVVDGWVDMFCGAFPPGFWVELWL